jgi:hypothetical protein
MWEAKEGGLGYEDRPRQKHKTLCGKITKIKKNWGYNLSGKVPIWQAQGPEFTPVPQKIQYLLPTDQFTLPHCPH